MLPPRDNCKTDDRLIARQRIAARLRRCAPDLLPAKLAWQRDPISSNRSRSIEVFAQLRRSWITHDRLSAHLINADFVVVRDFNFD
jgi:hypothetical protein